jgi:hypothetical protein
MPLLLKSNPDTLPVRFIEIEVHPDDSASRSYIGPDRRAMTSAQRSVGSA